MVQAVKQQVPMTMSGQSEFIDSLDCGPAYEPLC